MLSIHLFGHLRLIAGGEPIKFAALPKTLPLWSYLLLNRQAAIPRDNLAAVLWPDVSESEARANLRRHLHELRRVLPPTPDGNPWLLSDTLTVQWNPAGDYWLDVAEFERLAADADSLAEAVTLYSGDLLPSVYEDWIFFDRERLRDLYFSALGQLIEQSRSRHDLPQAIAYANQVLYHDPVREDVVREVMSLRYEMGDRAGAFQEYRQFEHRLQEELGVAPMPETAALYQAMVEGLPLVKPTPSTNKQTPVDNRQSPTAINAATPATLTTPPNNLSAQLTSFIGREDELGLLEGMLTAAGAGAAEVRLVTLTGPGGSGKTRLSLQLARRLLVNRPDCFPDGLFFVALAAIENPDLVAPVIAEALGIKENSTRPLLPLLKEQLRSRRLLLVLDNFEQVVEAAPVIGELLEAAPGLHILATSRIVLRLYGEYEFPVEPLALPNLKQLPPPDEVARFAAVALFLERARLGQPGYSLSAENAAAVAEICTRLDGLPLAIELAAAQSKLFNPAAMLAQLTDRLDFLRSRSRNLPERQQTLRATIDWSYNLLDENEKRLFCHLAVFSGIFTLVAAEAILDFRLPILDSIQNPKSKIQNREEPTSLLESFIALAEKSMIRQLAADNDTGMLRFRMLLTLREYALERLEQSGEADELRRRHAFYYLSLAQEARPKLHSNEQLVWLERLAAEEGNLRAALAWALSEAAPAEFYELAARATLDLPRFWQLRSHASEARLWFGRALARADLLPSEIQVRLLNQAGWEEQFQGNFAAADHYHEKALGLARQTGNHIGAANTLHYLGASAGRQSDFQRAAELLSESLTLHQEFEELRGSVNPLLNNLAIVYKRLGDYGRARSLLEEGLARVRQTGDKVSIANTLSNLGNVYALQGDYREAAGLQRESLTLRQAISDQRGLASSLSQLAELATSAGEYERAARLYGASEVIRQAIVLPLTAAAQEDIDRDRATILFALGEAAMTAASAEGRAMTLDEAIQYALA